MILINGYNIFFPNFYMVSPFNGRVSKEIFPLGETTATGNDLPSFLDLFSPPFIHLFYFFSLCYAESSPPSLLVPNSAIHLLSSAAC